MRNRIMNVLFLTLHDITDVHERGIYSDLVREFVRHGHSFYVVKPNERKTGRPTEVTESDGVRILGVRTLNIQKTNVVEKGTGTLLLEGQYYRAIRKYFKGVKFDLILYSTPPITFNKVIASLKSLYGARTYLLLKDIFPQNAEDLGMFPKGGLLHRFFRAKERRLYALSDMIGCMSPANVEYVLKHNPEVERKRVEVCPNSVEPVAHAEVVDRDAVLGRLGVPAGKTVFIYGGNLGKPQGIGFLLDVVEANERLGRSFIVVVGSGTEYPRVERWFAERRPLNSKLFKVLPKADYDRLVRVCDVGLIFLDRRFTIPNYPSRLLSYLENGMPVLMATDVNTDIGRIAQENGYGDWVESGDLAGFVRLLERYASDRGLVKEKGECGRRYLEAHYTVAESYAIIMRHFE